MKPKKIKRSRVATIAIITFFVCIVCLIGIVSLIKNKAEKATRSLDRIMVYTTEKSALQDGWWMKDFPAPSPAIFEYLAFKKRYIIETLEEAQGYSAEAPKLLARFRDSFQVGVYRDSHAIVYPNLDGANKSPRGNEIGIVFIPMTETWKGKNISPRWEGPDNYLSVPAFELPKPLFAGIVYHELGHAYRHNKFDGTTHSINSVSDEGCVEEIAMHTLTADILDGYSAGKFRKRIHDIVARIPARAGYEVAIAALTEEDQMYFDALFECTHRELGRIFLATVYVLEVGFRAEEMRGTGMPGKIVVYRWFVKHTSVSAVVSR